MKCFEILEWNWWIIRKIELNKNNAKNEVSRDIEIELIDYKRNWVKEIDSKN